MELNPEIRRVLVSGFTNPTLLKVQRDQVRILKNTEIRPPQAIESLDVCHIQIPFGLRRSPSQFQENSQRTRAVAFLAFGAVTAMQAEVETVSVYENGLGALNLPLNATQLGISNYRGVHPVTLALAGKLFGLVLGRNVRFENPFFYWTKGEMCEGIEGSKFRRAIAATVSCDRFPRRAFHPQCGYCTSCVLRRMSLKVAGLAKFDPSANYAVDIWAPGKRLPRDELFGFQVMRDQAAQFASCLDQPDPWRSIVSTYPEIITTQSRLRIESGGPNQFRPNLLRLLSRYSSEWAALNELNENGAKGTQRCRYTYLNKLTQG